MGVPTPNLFDGSMNFHGKKEYVPLEWMELAVETLLHLMDVWVERVELTQSRTDVRVGLTRRHDESRTRELSEASDHSAMDPRLCPPSRRTWSGPSTTRGRG